MRNYRRWDTRERRKDDLSGLPARQQADTNRNQFRLHLFDRRYAVFEAAIKFVRSVCGKGDITDEEVREFWTATRGTPFLFNKEVQDYCDTLRQRALDVQTLKKMIDGTLGPAAHRKTLDPNHPQNVKRRAELLKWFSNEAEEMSKRFAPFLKIEG